MFPRAWGSAAGADFATVTSEAAATPAWVVEAEALSLPVLSFGVPVIEAVFVKVGVPVGVFAGTETTIETVAELFPAANVPRLQVTVAVSVPARRSADLETKLTPAGSVSVTVTPVAAVFPVCEAVRA